MKKIKFIKYAGTGLGLLGATMNLSYGLIDPNDYLVVKGVENIFSYSQKDHQEEDIKEVLKFLENQKANIHSINITDCSF